MAACGYDEFQKVNDKKKKARNTKIIVSINETKTQCTYFDLFVYFFVLIDGNQ